MRRLIKRLPKKPKKVIARETCVAGNLVEVEREIVATVNEVSGAVEPLENFGRCYPRLSCVRKLSHYSFFALIGGLFLQ